MADVAVRAVPLPALSPAHLDAWHVLHRTNPLLDSPYFHPAFAAAVHAAGPPVEVLVTTDAHDAPVALLPFHHDGRHSAVPVGWPGADFQSPIVSAGVRLGVRSVLPPGCRAMRFDHLVETAAGLDRWIVTRRPSPHLDVAGGLEGYLGRASRTGRENLGQARRRMARAERELGPIRFDVDLVDDAVLDRLMALKRAQYAATGVRDHFAPPERVDLLRRLVRTRTDGFGGIMSAVHIDGRLVAAHVGIRSGGVLHWWFPVYDPQFSQLAPGWMLLRLLIEAAPGLGVDRIDLGRGEDEYKRRAKTGERTVAEGVVGSPLRVVGHRARRRSVQAVRSSPWAGPLRTALRRATRTVQPIHSAP